MYKPMPKTIIPFSGNSHKTPAQERRLTPYEAPIRKATIDEVDVSVMSLKPHKAQADAVQSRQAVPPQTETVPSNVEELASHPRYQYYGTENDPLMAQLAREAIEHVHQPLQTGAEDVQKAA